LFEALWEPCLRFARGQSALRGASEDDVREVVTRFIAKLEQEEHRALQLYLDWATRHPEKSFADWLKIALSNAARDYGRELRGGEARAVPGEPSAKRLLNELAKQLPLDDVGVRPPVTDAQTARQLLEFAQRELPPDQRTALLEWLQGASFEMIAETSALPGPEDAKRLVRAAVAVLRRQFG
jgi:DNA-directed RNA polymerase specialized sigma24 family protein